MKMSTTKIFAFAVLCLTLISASSRAEESVEAQVAKSGKTFDLVLARGGMGGFPSGMGPGGLQNFKIKKKDASKKPEISDDY